MTVKMPEPMTAPMPSEVRESGPSVLRSLFSGSSDSAMSLSMDLQAKTWRGRMRLLCGKNAIRGVYSADLPSRQLLPTPPRESHARRGPRFAWPLPMVAEKAAEMLLDAAETIAPPIRWFDGAIP